MEIILKPKAQKALMLITLFVEQKTLWKVEFVL